MMTFWQSLPKPFLVLAPLEGVADTVFRRIVASCAKPDVFFTEFTSADGFCSPGKKAVADNFVYTPEEKPIIAQIWGKNPETLYNTAREAALMGFDGIDINMGCPDRTVMLHGGGAAMIDTPAIAAAAIQAIKDGIKAAEKTLPVSVKTRLGNKKNVADTWLPFLLEQGLDALTIHARTAKELSKVPARWEEVGKLVELRDRMKVNTIIVGNGDVKDAKEAQEKYEMYRVDGVMIGRGIFQNPWAFDRSPLPHRGTPQEHLEVMERHVRLFTEVWGNRKNYAILKTFYKIYINNFHGATDWRVRAMATNSAPEVLALLEELKATNLV